MNHAMRNLHAIGLLLSHMNIYGAASRCPKINHGISAISGNIDDENDSSPKNLGWEKKKRDRYNELIKEGYFPDVAEILVEFHKGKSFIEKNAPKVSILNDWEERHTLYKPYDFTREELERHNILAVLVIRQGINICKQCGKAQLELEKECK